MVAEVLEGLRQGRLMASRKMCAPLESESVKRLIVSNFPMSIWTLTLNYTNNLTNKEKPFIFTLKEVMKLVKHVLCHTVRNTKRYKENLLLIDKPLSSLLSHK